jgi:hypothetical protein
MKHEKIRKTVVVAAAAVAITVAVGKIIPMNLLHASGNYSGPVDSQCCGPYAQCNDTKFQGT